MEKNYKKFLDTIDKTEKIKKYLYGLLFLIVIVSLFTANYLYQKSSSWESTSQAISGNIIKNKHYSKRASSFFECTVALDNQQEVNASCWVRSNFVEGQVDVDLEL